MAAQASDSHPPGQLHDSRGSLPSFDPTRHANRRQTKIVKLSRTDPHAGIAPQPPNNCVPTVLVISGRLAPTSQKHLSFPNHGWLTPADGIATFTMYKRTISATSGGCKPAVAWGIAWPARLRTYPHTVVGRLTRSGGREPAVVHGIVHPTALPQLFARLPPAR